MNKQGYHDDEFDLDLCYITDQIIAISLPSEGIQGAYRNPIDKVAQFFKKKHPDSYLIFDCCEEHTYDYAKFDGSDGKRNVQQFKFTDHGVPQMSLIQELCFDAAEHMSMSESHVVAVHCRGGKGRTGSMICALLQWTYTDSSPQDVLDWFTKMRTDEQKASKMQGVETASQVRYQFYFHRYIKMTQLPGGRTNDNFLTASLPVQFHKFRIGPFHAANDEEYVVSILMRDFNEFQKKDVNFEFGRATRTNTAEGAFIEVESKFKFDVVLRGDVQMLLHRAEVGQALKKRGLKTALASFWINTAMITPIYDYPAGQRGKDEPCRFAFQKDVIDELPRNDKKHKDVPAEFTIELYCRQRAIDDLTESTEFFGLSALSSMFVSNPKGGDHHG